METVGILITRVLYALAIYHLSFWGGALIGFNEQLLIDYMGVGLVDCKSKLSKL